MSIKKKQFSLWQIMKGAAIAAIITSAMMPLIQNSDKILANPGLFIGVMVLVFLAQLPMLLLPNFIDWVLGNKPSKPSEKTLD